MKAQRNGNNYFHFYDDVTDYIKHIREPIDSELSRTSNDTYRHGPDFFGTKTLEEALELAEKGWPEGLAKAEEFSTKLNEDIQGHLKLQEMHYDVTGDMLDIGRFVAGEPEDFGSLVDTMIPVKSVTPKIVRVVLNIATSGSVSKETMEMRGAAVIAMIDALERHGKRVDLHLVFSSTGSRSKDFGVHVSVHVKHADEPLQLDKLAFLLAHASSCRRLAWASIEHMPDDMRKATGFDGGYCGLPSDSPLKGDITIQKIISYTDWTHAYVLEWILETLATQGLEVTERERV